ncbi:MAG TPA: GH3 auxin-responsive promoter family protein, partial [Planctomycetaceae bacterium]|nr:GH3 auxin-responsive promoter family protein [Planctomycetaceae bacterium]
DFRRQVPIQSYEQLEPYIERVKQGDTEALFHRQRVRMFALTSGTTSARKFIPVTDRVLDSYRRLWTAWGLLAYSAHRDLFRHARLTLVSDWDEFRTPAGIPCGSISGFTAQLQNWIVRRGYVLPPESGKLADYRAKYYLTWRLGLGRTIGSWMSPNPSTLLNLAKFGSDQAERLLRDLRDGTLSRDYEWPEPVRQAVRSQLSPQPARVRDLEQILARTDGLRPRDVWPELKLLGCWTGGSMGVYLRSFPEQFGDATVRDLGLLASEGRMTFPIADGTPAGVLEIVSGFFEFVPVDEIDSPQPTVLEAHELVEGCDYYILLTNASGLYRYNIRDVVRCTGRHHATPLLAFLNKGSGIVSVTGEKLTEHQVVAAMSTTLASLGWTLSTFTLVPLWQGSQPYYGLLVEESELPDRDTGVRLAAAVDDALQQANCEYATKRQTNRLGPVRIRWLPAGTWHAWRETRLAKTGGSMEQYKHPCLLPDAESLTGLPKPS